MSVEAKAPIAIDVNSIVSHYRQQLADANERAIIAAATADAIGKAYEAKEAELVAAQAKIAELELATAASE